MHHSISSWTRASAHLTAALSPSSRIIRIPARLRTAQSHTIAISFLRLIDTHATLILGAVVGPAYWTLVLPGAPRRRVRRSIVLPRYIRCTARASAVNRTAVRAGTTTAPNRRE
jgi:hypothetical protein